MPRVALLLMVPVLAAACLSSDTSPVLAPTDANVTGAFFLSTINGSSLPVIASVTATQEYDLLSDTVSMASDGTWSETSVYQVRSLTDQSTSSLVTVVGGSYTISKQQINFVETTGGTLTFAGSVRGDQLTIIFGGSQFFYNRST